MPYELIRYKYGKNTVHKLQFFGIDQNYLRIFKGSLKNYPAIFNWTTGENFEDFTRSIELVLSTLLWTINPKLIKSVFSLFRLPNR